MVYYCCLVFPFLEVGFSQSELKSVEKMKTLFLMAVVSFVGQNRVTKEVKDPKT